MTANDLAVILGVSTSTITAWERDEAEPSLEHLALLSSFFKKTTDELLGLDRGVIDVSFLRPEYRVIIQKLVEYMDSVPAPPPVDKFGILFTTILFIITFYYICVCRGAAFYAVSRLFGSNNCSRYLYCNYYYFLFVNYAYNLYCILYHK